MKTRQVVPRERCNPVVDFEGRRFLRGAKTLRDLGIPRFARAVPFVGICGLLVAITALPAAAQTWTEVQDAPELVPGQSPGVSGVLNTITGTLEVNDLVDMYCINIPNPSAFSATLSSGSTQLNPLFLFNPASKGITSQEGSYAGGTPSSITGAFVPAAGRYYLAIGTHDDFPDNSLSQHIWFASGVETPPDGPGFANPVLASWDPLVGIFIATGPYTINLTGVAGSCCLPPPTGMVAWWALDETTGLTAFDSVGNHDGTYQPSGSGPIQTPGYVGYGLQFDGVDDVVNIPYAPNLNPATAMTIDAWVRTPTPTSVNNGPVIYGTQPGDQLLYVLPSGQVRAGWIVGGSTSWVDSLSAVPANTWTHVAATYDSLTGEMKVYLNGALENTATFTGAITSAPVARHIGGLPGQPNFFWQGLIDEVEVFNVALSQPNIAAIHAAGSAGKCKCEPLPDGSDCATTACPDSNDICRPTERVLDVVSGLTMVTKCDCVNAKECYLEPSVSVPPRPPSCLGLHCPGTNKPCELTATQTFEHGVCVNGVCVGGLNHGLNCLIDAECLDKETITYDCCSPGCEPLPDGSGCTETVCQGFCSSTITQQCTSANGCPVGETCVSTTGKQCKPTEVLWPVSGSPIVTKCDCVNNGEECFIIFDPYSGHRACMPGICPFTGAECPSTPTPTLNPDGSTTYACCPKEPPPELCPLPTPPPPLGDLCTQLQATQCIGPSDESCRPTRLVYNPTANEYTADDCDCVDSKACYLAVEAVGPPFPDTLYVACRGLHCPGTNIPCQLTTTNNGDGTTTYECCQCGSSAPGCCGAPPAFLNNLAPDFTEVIAVATHDRPCLTDYVVHVIDLTDQATAPIGPPPTGQNWTTPYYNPPTQCPATPPTHSTWTKAFLGTVFGAALDNAGNIYLAHSSVYGDPNAGAMITDWLGVGGAGAVYKINTNTAVATVFAVLPNTQDPNIPIITGLPPSESWPGLGNLAFDCERQMLYVTNEDDGRIYRLDAAGNVVSTFDHATGTVASGGFPEPGDAPGFVPPIERPWAVQPYNGRIYYSTWDSGPNPLWSVAVDSLGEFDPLTHWQQLVFSGGGFGGSHQPVSDITFAPSGCMIAAERTMFGDTLSNAHQSRLLEFCFNLLGTGTWDPSGNLFDVGAIFSLDNSAGGVDFDFLNSRVFVTADVIQLYPNPQVIYGLQGLPATGGNVDTSIQIDLDQQTTFVDKYKIGSVEVSCPSANCCKPLADASGCQNSICPNSNDMCKPTEFVYNPITQETTVTKCDCVNADDIDSATDECYLVNVDICQGNICPLTGTPCSRTPTATLNLDGTTTYACCPKERSCPLENQITPDPCINHSPDECLSTDPTTTCLPKCVEITQGPGGLYPTGQECACADPGCCGSVDIALIGPSQYGLTCLGSCLASVCPATDGRCEILVNGVSRGQISVQVGGLGGLPIGDEVCCKCVPCNDGAFCNGVETVDPSGDCIAGDPPCAVDFLCDEENDTCLEAIPTVSDWGLVVLTLLLLIGAKIYFGRRDTATAL